MIPKVNVLIEIWRYFRCYLVLKKFSQSGLKLNVSDGRISWLRHLIQGYFGGMHYKERGILPVKVTKHKIVTRKQLSSMQTIKAGMHVYEFFCHWTNRIPGKKSLDIVYF